jgi:hypothetical protein
MHASTSNETGEGAFLYARVCVVWYGLCVTGYA